MRLSSKGSALQDQGAPALMKRAWYNHSSRSVVTIQAKRASHSRRPRGADAKPTRDQEPPSNTPSHVQQDTPLYWPLRLLVTTQPTAPIPLAVTPHLPRVSKSGIKARSPRQRGGAGDFTQRGWRHVMVRGSVHPRSCVRPRIHRPWHVDYVTRHVMPLTRSRQVPARPIRNLSP